MTLKARLEAVLFAADQPLGWQRLAEVLGEKNRDTLKEAVTTLENEYEASQRAFQVVRVAGGLQLATRPEYAETVRRLYTGRRRVRLTRAALEALAIIAYKQPTTRPEIDAIRGVSSGGVVETLLERNLIRIAGRAEGVGRPLLYATTPEFLQYLGLDRLKDLPSLEELESMLAEKEAEERRQEEEELAELTASVAAGVVEEGAVAASAPVEGEASQADLATLEELDAELEARRAALDGVTARLEPLRAGGSQETAPAADAVESPAPPAKSAAPEAPEAPRPAGPDDGS